MQIDGKTQLIGLLGWPVSHTQSPRLHNTLSDAYEQNIVYLPLPVHPDAVGDALRGLPALGFRGVNVTVPHKQTVMAYLDEIDPAATAIGAVNTISFVPNNNGRYPPRVLGTNTDWIGLRDDLYQLGERFDGRDCLVLGAGGSARAVVYMLLQDGAAVHLFARRIEQAEQLKADMMVHFPDGRVTCHLFNDLGEVTDQVEKPLVLNTTPVGMHPNVDQSIWPDELGFPEGCFIYDLVYTPATTKLMRQAAAVGCGASNGLGMLLGQGAEAYRIWTGIDVDIKVLEEAFAS